MSGYLTFGIGCGSDADERGGELTLEDSSSDSVGYLRGGVRCLIRGGKGGSIFEISAGFHGPSMRISAFNAFEDNKGAIKLAVNKHASRRTWHVDVKHHLVRDACEAGKIRVVYVSTGSARGLVYQAARQTKVLQACKDTSQ